jgi:hypothetical protein
MNATGMVAAAGSAGDDLVADLETGDAAADGNYTT